MESQEEKTKFNLNNGVCLLKKIIAESYSDDNQQLIPHAGLVCHPEIRNESIIEDNDEEENISLSE